MPFRIIDNKKVEMTEDEWRLYEEICHSYDNPPTQRGKDLFIDLFEVDNDGIIIYLKPPNFRPCSFEVMFFLMGLMSHQHLRVMYKKVDEKLKEIDELKEKINKGLSND